MSKGRVQEGRIPVMTMKHIIQNMVTETGTCLVHIWPINEKLNKNWKSSKKSSHENIGVVL